MSHSLSPYLSTCDRNNSLMFAYAALRRAEGTPPIERALRRRVSPWLTAIAAVRTKHSPGNHVGHLSFDGHGVGEAVEQYFDVFPNSVSADDRESYRDRENRVGERVPLDVCAFLIRVRVKRALESSDVLSGSRVCDGDRVRPPRCREPKFDIVASRISGLLVPLGPAHGEPCGVEFRRRGKLELRDCRADRGIGAGMSNPHPSQIL